MDSPYHPGFGARPAVLVGREQQLTRASASLTRVANSSAAAPSAMVLTGARGLGKTVTLAVIGDTATERGFITASVAFDSVSDNVQLLARPGHHLGTRPRPRPRCRPSAALCPDFRR